MRIVIIFCLIFLYAQTSSAGTSYRIPADTSQLLADALKPAASPQERFEKYTAAESLRYRLPRDADLMRAHLPELEALYQDINRNDEAKASVAAVLLALDSHLDHVALTMDALKYTRPLRSKSIDGPENLLKALAEQTPPDRASDVLGPLFTGDAVMRWYNDYPTLSAVADVTAGLLPQVPESDRKTVTANIFRIRMKLADRFAADKIQEEKFHGTITIWDDKTQTDIDALLARFDGQICRYPPKPALKNWHYTFVPMHAMFESGQVKMVDCHE